MIELMISFCDESGIMCRPWAEGGYSCYAVDLMHPVRKAKEQLFEGGGKIIYTYGDARYWTPPHEQFKIVFFASFPVCTDMAGSGAQDWSNKRGTPRKGIPQLCDALMLFNSCYNAARWSGAPFVVENPSGVIPTHFRKSDYTFHPWHYGEDYQKQTCLWTGNGFKMPEKSFVSNQNDLFAVNHAGKITQKIWTMPPGKDRATERSKTPESFARAVYVANKPNTII